MSKINNVDLYSLLQLIIYLSFLHVNENISLFTSILRIGGFILYAVAGVIDMDYIEWFYKRVAELRIQKGVSARDMSLSLGQSESYINKIENKRTLPSFTGFLYICEYFELTPQEFFNTNTESPQRMKELIREMEKLSPSQAEHILQVVKDINRK